jgi:hypothetical protein
MPYNDETAGVQCGLCNEVLFSYEYGEEYPEVDVEELVRFAADHARESHCG